MLEVVWNDLLFEILCKPDSRASPISQLGKGFESFIQDLPSCCWVEVSECISRVCFFLDWLIDDSSSGWR